jgi:gluconolactonase
MNLNHPAFFCVLMTNLLPMSLQAAIPIAEGASLIREADGFAFTEGPAADRAGNVYFTDQPNNRILRWDAKTREVHTFLAPSGRSNGMTFSRTAPARLLACADDKGELWSIDPEDASVIIILSPDEEQAFNGPNDLWVHPSGSIYFTDPLYKRPYWENRDLPEGDKQPVFRLDPGASHAVIVEDTLIQPNGIIGTPDGHTLYIADIGAKQTWAYTVLSDGSLSGRRLFCELGSDGMTLDEAGNLYLTGRGVTVYAPDSTLLGNIPVPENWTANVTFGGTDHRTLFITAMGSVYTLEMAVRGAEAP